MTQTKKLNNDRIDFNTTIDLLKSCGYDVDVEQKTKTKQRVLIQFHDSDFHFTDTHINFILNITSTIIIYFKNKSILSFTKKYKSISSSFN